MSQSGGPKNKIASKLKSGATKATGAVANQARKAGSGVAKSAAFMYGNAKDTVVTTPRAAKNLATQPVATIKGAAKGVKGASASVTAGLKTTQHKRGTMQTATMAGMMATGAGIVMAASQGAAHMPAKGVVTKSGSKKSAPSSGKKKSDFDRAADDAG